MMMMMMMMIIIVLESERLLFLGFLNAGVCGNVAIMVLKYV
jgi:hypothetical protein